MDVKEAFKNFHLSKFVLFGCLIPFSILLSLKLNGNLDWSIWTVFIPIWLFNLTVIIGTVVGTVSWCCHPEYRYERDSHNDYKAMLMTAGLQLLLFLFEVLICHNVASGNKFSWILVFVPMFLAVPISIAVSVWGHRNRRSVEFEIVIAVNALFFVFVALRLDQVVLWSWVAVFIPLWIVMCAPSIAVLHYFIWALILYRSTYQETGKAHFSWAIIGMVVVVSLLTFQVLLVHKLEGVNEHDFAVIFIPLHICLIALIASSFEGKGGNKWWFGIRSDFCQFLLERFPSLQLYGNISYKYPSTEERNPSNAPTNIHIHGASKKKNPSFTNTSGRYGPVVAIECIETPD